MDAYEYRPINLERPAFRLLRLLKGAGSDIKCELVEAWLGVEDLMHYEAVSYTWGTIELSASVEIDGRPLNVTENLYLALQYLRMDKEDRILWVDAICIDQSNRQEQGHQVKQMGNIYSQADRVVVWLGPATDDTNVLMDSLKRLEQESNKIAYSNWTLGDCRWRDLWTSLQPGLKKQHWNLAVKQRAGLESLLQRPWFDRIWILQEVANAKRAIVCSGPRSVSTRIFVIAPLLLHIKLEPGRQAVLDIMPGPSRRESWWNLEPDLYTLLIKFKRSKAGDPRDMIYALLGICSDAQDARVIPVDYTKEPEEVVRDAASFLFDMSDCFYSSVSKLMDDAVSLNAELFLKKVKSENVNRVCNFLRFRGDTVEVTREVLEAAAGNTESGAHIMQLLLKERGEEAKVTEEVLKAAAKNIESGKQVIQLLLEQRQDETLLVAARGEKERMEYLLCHHGVAIKITEEVVKAAAGNSKSGEQVVRLLLEQRRDAIKVTEEVFEAAAGNRGSGEQVMRLLLNQQRDEVKITEELVKAAAGNTRSGKQVTQLLIDWRGDEVKVTEEVVKAAAGNTESGKQVMDLLLDWRREAVKVTDEVVKAAAGNGKIGRQMMSLLLVGQRGHAVKITEEVVKAAAGNLESGEQVMQLLLNWRREEVQITEEVLRAAAGNTESGAHIMRLLLRERGEEVKVTEEVLKAAAKNIENGQQVMLRLLRHQRGDEVKVTEEVFKAAAGNTKSGAQIMRLLLRERGEEVKVTEEVLKAAAGNTKSGARIMQLLLRERGEEVKVTEEVFKAAAENTKSGQQVVQLLLRK